MIPHDGPPLFTPKKLEEEKGGLPRLLLGRFGRTIRLIVRMSRSEGRMIRTTRFCNGCIPLAITSQISLTLALLTGSAGINGRFGLVSSKYCRIFNYIKKIVYYYSFAGVAVLAKILKLYVK
ncbi:hypothetical protein ALC53_05929 [Atta colombica]|uniref:Uncharacterized protein n=1 Tax=Atta colombica TaxID=520822 RepID=A0A195BH98_9HYME|nr:hypothetical protein ALC53_05929 [Atta colombica]